MMGVLVRPSGRRCPVRVPRACYQLEETIAAQLPELRPAQRRGLALWAYGAVIAGSAGQVAVLAALLPLGGSVHALRQYLREWLDDGADRAAARRPQLDVATCFAPLLRWGVAWWQGSNLARA